MREQNSVRPSIEQLRLLSRFERASFAFADFANSNPLVKAASHSFLRSVGMSWVYQCTRNLTHLVGVDELQDYRPPRGLILACNHRSFFDMYVLSCWMFRETQLLQRIYFPVRAEFFYEKPAGFFVNLLMAGMSMYPPVFRNGNKRDFNRYGLKRLVQLLQQPGTVIGMHPEGRRNVGDDPYALQKAQPGIGKLILESRADVLPCFINGLGNDLPRQIGSNFTHTGDPVIIVLGKPLDLSNFFGRRSTLRTQKELADHVVDQIQQLTDVEREQRQRLSR